MHNCFTILLIQDRDLGLGIIYENNNAKFSIFTICFFFSKNNVPVMGRQLLVQDASFLSLYFSSCIVRKFSFPPQPIEVKDQIKDSRGENQWT